MTMNLSVIESAEPERLTKRWSMVDDKPVKAAAGQMTRGRVVPLRIDEPEALVSTLQRLEKNQALCFGVPADGKNHPICTQSALEATGLTSPDAIARTNQFFRWPAQSSWLLLDYDPAPGVPPLDRDGLLAALYDACPGLRGAAMVWGPSASSYIYNGETQVTGLQGQRLYVLVADGRDIERAGRALFDRLWLAGQGYYAVSNSGRLLARAPIDASVWQPCRLDFAAPPVCVAPLEHRRPEPEALNAGAAPLNTPVAIPELNSRERAQLKELMVAACSDAVLQTRCRDARQAWVQKRLAALPPTTDEAQYEVVRSRLHEAVENQVLTGGFQLLHRSGEQVTVRQILDDPERWHGERFADPLEAGEDHRVAWLNLRSGGRPYLYSHAHGGQRYVLARAKQSLMLTRGDSPQIVADILQRLRSEACIFERAGQLVRLADGELVAVEAPWLRTYLETSFRFTKLDARSKDWQDADCPKDLVERVMAARGDWDLPKISGVVDHPVMRPDGTILNRSGFDISSGLLFLNDRPERGDVEPLDSDGLRATLDRIWAPFAQFPFEDDLSRAVWLAALLTTVVRPTLPTAPAFLINAHAPGSGKTLLSECLMLLVGAAAAALPLPDSDPAEIEKRLFAKLMTGCSGLVLDNLQGTLESAALCATLTSAEPEGRILGQSVVVRQQNRALFVLNGNNVSAGGDLFRRVLPVTLDANTESPESRAFPFDPRELVRTRLQEYRADLIAVLATYQAEGAPRLGAGGLGSFGEWEQLVRQCVCWVSAGGCAPVALADPLEVLKRSKAEDPRHLQHAAILEAWYARFGAKPVKVRELAKIAEWGPASGEGPESAFGELLREVGTSPKKRCFASEYFSGWMRRYRGRVVSGLRLDLVARDDKRGAIWAVTRV
ncbi:MAG: hypothetical protein KUL86_14460 [Castellaniella sp.]|nr:hypothetical protein [Castellaniella sp.]